MKALIVFALAVGAAHATVVEAIAVEDLVVRANTVLEGEVVAQEAAWEGQIIVTEVHVAVTRCWKGPCDQRSVIRIMGGEVGELGMQVSGVARFQNAERVLLFLQPSKVTGRYRTLGMAQGKFALHETILGIQAVRSGLPTLAGPDRALVRGELVFPLRRLVETLFQPDTIDAATGDASGGP